MRTVLFICTGNTCRSPMAEAIARQHLQSLPEARQREIFIASAGISAPEGVATSAETLNALADLGIDFAGRSKRLTAPMIRNAELVLCMTASQQAAARELVAGEAEHEAKVRVIDDSGDIEDPVGMGQPSYNALSQRLRTIIPRVMDEFLAAQPAASRRAGKGARKAAS